MGMAYNPKTVGNDTDLKVLYVTPASAADGFIEAYPSGQTLTELSPSGDTCAASTLSTTTW
tara:strand:- start:291 stop:473 length:183 start_codon:yes stop_codon:yes gene_type:complete